jgi:cytochrome o ubiquinol oxidase subunit III
MSRSHQKTADEKTFLGFWVYLMTDLVLFATLFVTFIVLRDNVAGGPAGSEIFELPFVLTETLILLASSFSVGLALLSARSNKKIQTLGWLSVTFILGLAFLILEISEFSHFINEGHGWQQSAFLSSFFTLVGTHGLHITAGLIWMATMIWQTASHGLIGSNRRRLTMLSVFWHFLDIVWIFIFTIVYLFGVIA